MCHNKSNAKLGSQTWLQPDGDNMSLFGYHSIEVTLTDVITSYMQTGRDMAQDSTGDVDPVGVADA